MNGEGLFNLDDTWVDEGEVEGELDGLLTEVENDQFLDEIGAMGEEVVEVIEEVRLPVQAAAPEAVGLLATPVPAVAMAAAVTVLIVEVVSISHAVLLLDDKDDVQTKVDSLNRIRDEAFQKHQWTDQLQSEWTKAMDGLAHKAEDLQNSLKNTLIGKLIFWD